MDKKLEFKTFIMEKIDALDASPKIKEILNYSLINDGKLIRPLLFLSCVDYKREYYNVALALELIHTYSLIHDDLPALDNDDLRRGKPTCHRKFGEAEAILAGDMLLTWAFEVISDCPGINDSVKVKMIKYLSSNAGMTFGMISGQMSDIRNECKTLDQLNQMYIQKTSCLLSCSLVLANFITFENEQTKLEELAYDLGLLYQIQDDYFDEYGLVSQIGKNIGSDSKNKKITYCSFYDQNELESLMESKKEKINRELNNLNLKDNTKSLIKQILERSN